MGFAEAFLWASLGGGIAGAVIWLITAACRSRPHRLRGGSISPRVPRFDPTKPPPADD